MIMVQLMSFGGKVGVNIFFLISGYFLIRSTMKWEKALKLTLEMLFYNILACIILQSLGYNYTFKDYLGIIPFIFSVPGFMSTYIVIYILSPFLNKVLLSINKKEHILLSAVLLGYFSILQTFLGQNSWDYLGWGISLYIIGGGIRLYKPKIGKNKTFGLASLLCILLTWGGILFIDFWGVRHGHDHWHFFIGDANKLNIFAIALFMFLFFLNTNIKYNKIINLFASASFGVFLLHANNDIMRKWLWQDLFQNTEQLSSPSMWLHAIAATLAIYIVITPIDIFRQHYIEKPLFKYISADEK